MSTQGGSEAKSGMEELYERIAKLIQPIEARLSILEKGPKDQIDEGDEITMNYCHIKKTLKLSYNKINITMSKVDSKILKTLTPCLIFQYPGDEIEIIELKQII